MKSFVLILAAENYLKKTSKNLHTTKNSQPKK